MRACSKRSFGEEMPSAEYFPVNTVAGSLVILPIFLYPATKSEAKKVPLSNRKKA